MGALRLIDPQLGTLELDDQATGIAFQQLDLGWPAVREVSTDRPGASGAVDQTALHGNRAVSVTLTVWDASASSRQQVLDRIAAFCHPSRRPVMEWQPPGGGVRRMVVAGRSKPETVDSPALSKVQAQFVAPDGVLTGDTRSVTLQPSQSAPGLAFPWSFDLAFPAFVGGPAMAVNNGSTWADGTALIYGPCAGPALTNTTTGETISFPFLTIAAGDYLEVKTRDRTALLNSVPGSSRYSLLDFARSSWWRVPPGSSAVTFTAATSSPPSVAVLSFTDTYL